MGTILFFVLAALAIGSALVVVFHRHPLIEALFLVVNLLVIAALFVLLGAYFLAVVQVLLYAGAIVVLITFVIMLLNLGPEPRGAPGLPTYVIAFVLGALFVLLLGRVALSLPAPLAPPGQEYGGIGEIARALFSTYFYPFEVVSLVIVAGLVGAVLLAKQRLED